MLAEKHAKQAVKWRPQTVHCSTCNYAQPAAVGWYRLSNGGKRSQAVGKERAPCGEALYADAYVTLGSIKAGGDRVRGIGYFTGGAPEKY
jgi:hypothetical protein